MSVNSRKAYESRLALLKEQLEGGKMFFTPQTQYSAYRLSKARYLPNGRVNLRTIDGIARATSLPLRMMMDEEFMERAKKQFEEFQNLGEEE